MTAAVATAEQEHTLGIGFVKKLLTSAFARYSANVIRMGLPLSVQIPSVPIQNVWDMRTVRIFQFHQRDASLLVRTTVIILKHLARRSLFSRPCASFGRQMDVPAIDNRTTNAAADGDESPAEMV